MCAEQPRRGLCICKSEFRKKCLRCVPRFVRRCSLRPALAGAGVAALPTLLKLAQPRLAWMGLYNGTLIEPAAWLASYLEGSRTSSSTAPRFAYASAGLMLATPPLALRNA